MTRIVTDGVEFTKRTVKMLKKAKELQDQPQTYTVEEIQAAKLPTPMDMWRTWSPDNKNMYKSNRYKGLKRVWQLWETYIWAGSYPILWLMVEKNKKKMLNKIEHEQR